LRQVAEDWSTLARAGKLGTHYGPVEAERYAALISAEKKPSLLLIGPSGVGKTEWVKELARRVGRAGGEDGARLWSTSADRIMAGMQYLACGRRCLAEFSGEGWLYVIGWRRSPGRTGASSIADSCCRPWSTARSA
jgi:ABC-type branched-subunit amino acid transport system ATPase component